MPTSPTSDPAVRPSLAPREPESTQPAASVASAPAPAVAPSIRVPRAALTSGRRWRQAARWIGLALFALGAGLLGFVFLQALRGFQQFQRPEFLSGEFNRVAGAGGNWQLMAQAAVGVLVSQLLSVLYLLLLGFLASAIASKGIQFFAASEAVIDEAVASVE